MIDLLNSNECKMIDAPGHGGPYCVQVSTYTGDDRERLKKKLLKELEIDLV